MIAYLLPLFITLSVETPIFFQTLKSKSLIKLLSIIFLNIVTNLLFNLIYINLEYSLLFLIIGEIIVFIFEAFVLYLLSKNFLSFLYSLIANSLSLIIGLIINKIVSHHTIDLYIATLIFEVIFVFYFLARIIILLISYLETTQKATKK